MKFRLIYHVNNADLKAKDGVVFSGVSEEDMQRRLSEAIAYYSDHGDLNIKSDQYWKVLHSCGLQKNILSFREDLL